MKDEGGGREDDDLFSRERFDGVSPRHLSEESRIGVVESPSFEVTKFGEHC